MSGPREESGRNIDPTCARAIHCLASARQAPARGGKEAATAASGIDRRPSAACFHSVCLYLPHPGSLASVFASTFPLLCKGQSKENHKTSAMYLQCSSARSSETHMEMGEWNFCSIGKIMSPVVLSAL